jgi:tetratricopeptide (TPR) repeat protein
MKTQVARWSLAVAIVAAMVIAPGFARAQTAEQKLQAKEHYNQARRFYDIGRYEEAVAEYQKVYLLVDDASMLYNMAQAYRLWGKSAEAVRFYRNFLRRAPDTSIRAEVEEKIKALTQPGASTAAPPTPTAPAPAPAQAPAPQPVAQQPVTPAPKAVAAPLPAPAAVVTTALAAPAPPPSKARTTRLTVAYGCLIGSCALFLTSLIAAVVGAGKHKELEKASNEGAVFDPRVESAGKASNKVANVTGVLGLLTGVTGGVLLVLDKMAENVPAGALFYPVVGPQVAGAGMRMTF